MLCLHKKIRVRDDDYQAQRFLRAFPTESESVSRARRTQETRPAPNCA